MNSHSAMHQQNLYPDVSIFVKDLNEATDERTLREIFAKYGSVVSCKLAYDEKGKSKGYAFVQYVNEQAARRAIERVNGKIVDNRAIFVGKFIPRKDRNKERDEKNVYTNLYVKNFGNDFTEDQLRQLFEPFGPIKSHKIMSDLRGRSKGFGFVAFEGAAFAEEALQNLNGKKMGNGRRLYVARAQKKSERQVELQRLFEEHEERKRRENSQGINLYVKNLDDTVTHSQLRREFSQYGPVTSAKVMTDSSGRSKGFGFVRFVSPVDACFAAAGLNGRVFGTKPLYVSLAQRREERRALLVAQHMRQRLQAKEWHPGQAAQASTFSDTDIPFSQGKDNETNVMISPALSPPSPSSCCQVEQSYSTTPWEMPDLEDSSVEATTIWRKSDHNPPPPMNPKESQPASTLWVPPAQTAFAQTQTQSSMLPPSPSIPTSPAANSCFNTPQSSQMLLTNMPPDQGQGQGQAPVQVQGHHPALCQIQAGGGMIPVKTFDSYTSFPPTDDPGEEKQAIGERLYLHVEQLHPHLAGKITGMLLEMDNSDLWSLLNNIDNLQKKIEEAYQVYRNFIKEHIPKKWAVKVKSLEAD